MIVYRLNPSSMRKGALAFLQSFRGGPSLARTSASLVPPVCSPQESRGEALHAMHRQPKKRRTSTQQRADAEPNSSDHDVDVLVTPPPEESTPPLLLEGDAYFVSHDGVARTYYQMEYDTSTLPLAIEEFYDLEGARKTFILRKTSPRTRVTIGTQQQQELVAEKTHGVVQLGDAIESLQIQEIESHDGLFGKAGTGATTWEASIAMSLFFSAHPHLLLGNVIELGSGVGLGGILSSFQHGTEFLDSWTFTDYNLHVLEQCKQNLKREADTSAMPAMNVCQLDWYDFGREGEASKQHLHKYDTVIACDCAYLYPDVVALSTAMEALLKRGEQSKIHIFGPYNRGALHELVRLLKEEKGLELTMEVFDMQRYRLKPLEGWDHSRYSDNSDKLLEYMRHQDESEYAAKYDARFLHVIASLPEAKDSSNNNFMSDID